MTHKHSEVVIFDIETTGLNKSTDRIVQFAAIVLPWNVVDSGLTGSWEDQAVLKISKFFLPDDGTEVGLGAYYKHHLSREVLKDYPGFGTFAAECAALFENRDTLSYNGMACDIPFITAELERYGYSVDWAARDNYDAYLVEAARNNNKLETAYARYTGTTLEESGLSAHDAFSDIIATAVVFSRQNTEEYQDPAKYVTNDGSLKLEEVEGELAIVFSHGKYYGIPVKVVVQKDPGYIRWVLSADFSARTKAIIQKFVNLYGK